MKKRPLYVFYHIPKCAGSTFTYHLKKNLKSNECLETYIDEGCFNTRQEIEDHLRSLPEEKKEKIHVIYGHHLYYGVHSLFERFVRYITFFRHPVDRTVSHYNYEIWQFRNNKLRADIKDKPIISSDGKILSLEEWICRRQVIQNFIVKNFDWALLQGKIKENILKMPREYLRNAKQVLDKFYFVGTFENYKNDTNFLFGKLGINKYYADQNISEKYFTWNEQNRYLRKLITEKCGLDMELYDYAVKLNRKRRAELKEYWFLVSSVRFRRRTQWLVSGSWFLIRQWLRCLLMGSHFMSETDSIRGVFSRWYDRIFKQPCR